jgi:hypothetical protein
MTSLILCMLWMTLNAFFLLLVRIGAKPVPVPPRRFTRSLSFVRVRMVF